jgi:thioredoxin reductase
MIVGAGPYGLALAGYAGHLGIDHVVAGKPMVFWRAHMPDGMYLRSTSDWHLDPLNVDTIEAYAATQGLTTTDVEPLSREFYLDYTEWFRNQQGIEPLPDPILRLDRAPDGTFHAHLASGDTIVARRVVLAMGFGAFKHVPADLSAILPPDRFGHTCDEVACAVYAGKRVIIVGGRQSAYEWTALLREAGAAEVHIVHRQDAPAFAEADWSWVGPLVDATIDNPGWYRRLSRAEKDDVGQRLYAEGRLKIEPWLEPRILRDGIHRWPNAQLASCVETPNGDLLATLDNGERLRADRVILATGYKVQIDQVPLLASGNILPSLRTRNGFPVLDERFETSVHGLSITSMPAAQDFGPFFAFTIAVRMSARVIGDHLARGAMRTGTTNTGHSPSGTPEQVARTSRS